MSARKFSLGLELAAAVILLGQGAAAADSGRTLRVGDRFRVAGGLGTVEALETLPLVTNEFSRRFRFDSWENPRLAELRERQHLADVVRSGADEFAQQRLLMHWAHDRFPKFGRPSTNCHGALAILSAIEGGHTFYCAHYAEVLLSAAASLGWIDRPLALRRHQGVNKVGGSTEHSVIEIWSNQHRKWVMLDPTSDLHLERAGVPLNAWEIRQEWFYQHGTNLTFVVGREGRRLRKADLPIALQTFPDFGQLTVEPDELDKYGFIGYIPNNDLLTSGYDYGQMFITKDALCAGTSWHVRTLPKDPAVDPYFPVGQAALGLESAGDGLRITLQTFTPNFSRYEARVDGGPWQPWGAVFAWTLHSGRNQVEARTANRFGVSGPISRAVVTVDQ